MSSDNIDEFANKLSTGVIIAVVISSIVGLAICIGIIVLIVCIIKQCSRPSYPRHQGMVLQQPYSYPYPQSWTSQYPPNMTSVSNYPPAYESVPPPYTASAPPPPSALLSKS